MIVDTINICVCYSLFLWFGATTMLTRIYLDFLFPIEVAVIVKDDLKYCGHIHTSSNFYKSYYIMVIKKKYQNLDLLTILIFYFVKNILTFLII